MNVGFRPSTQPTGQTRSQYQIDQTLLQEALALSNYPTATALIEADLREYIQRRKQLKILEVFGAIDYE